MKLFQFLVNLTMIREKEKFKNGILSINTELLNYI